MSDAASHRRLLDIRPFLELVDQELYGNVTGSINHAGESTTAVLLVFGPNHEEVEGVQLRLAAALLDFVRWQQTNGSPPES
jgi:hypothetical protein